LLYFTLKKKNLVAILSPVEKRLSLAHQNGLSLANFGSPATYMPAVMLTADEFCSSLGIIFLSLAHLVCAPGITCYSWQICNRCAEDKISENLKKFKKIHFFSKIF
jgi:hypothetical protein